MMVMQGVTNRHELRRRATRDSLREAALAKFVERGFDNVTVAEIAQEVGVTERTFYRHFATKEAVLFHDYQQRLEWLSASLAMRPTTESLFDSVAAAMRSFPDDLEIVRQAALLRSSLISSERGADQLRVVEAAFAAEFQEHFRKRYSNHPEVDLLAVVAGNALAGAAVAAVDVWGQRGCVDDIETMVNRAIAFLRSGLDPSS
jgi:AcrR family transcriptional regulator